MMNWTGSDMASTTSAADLHVAVMGILNVTSDSFSDGGRYLAPERAITHGIQLHTDGAGIIDVGGESTRPGARRIGAELERSRVLPVITGLVASGITVSVDTMRADVAEAATAAGATYINDVSGGCADPRMYSVAAASGAHLILNHWVTPTSYRHHQTVREYANVVDDVRDHLDNCATKAIAAGVDARSLIIDPGLGFAKSASDNWALLAALPSLVASGTRVLIGASRKRFLGTLLANGATERPVDDRDTATAAISVLAARAEVWGVRVHDPRSSVDALLTTQRWERAEAETAHFSSEDSLVPSLHRTNPHARKLIS